MTPISDALAASGPHERKIRALFSGAFVWQGDRPLFSKPLYILAFTNRSGSDLLADYLRQTGRFRGFGEGLNWDGIKRSLERHPVASFPDYIAQLAGAPNEPGIWGVKASWDQIVTLQRANIQRCSRVSRSFIRSGRICLGRRFPTGSRTRRTNGPASTRRAASRRNSR